MQERIKLLYIDDDRPLLEMMRCFFKRLDYAVFTADNGKQGLEIFNAQKPDIVLVDLKMPGISGLEVLKTITEQLSDTPVLVISGESKIADVIQAFRFGAWHYQTKPIKNLAIVQHEVEQALKRSKRIKENKAYQKELENERAAMAARIGKLNEALKAMVEERDIEKRAIEENLINDMKSLILPLIEKMASCKHSTNECKVCCESFRENILRPLKRADEPAMEIFREFNYNEIRIVELIRRDKGTKEIAESLNLAPGSVSWYRSQIRNKLGLTNAKTNLRSFLKKNA